MNKIKLILADDHPLIREGFKSLLGKSGDFEIVAEAEDGKELIETAMNIQADVLLVDITMPHFNGIEAITRIKEKNSELKFIILTMHEERGYIVSAVKAGVDGYLLKNIEKEDLIKAIKKVFAGEKYFSPSIAAILASSLTDESGIEHSDITAREKEVLQLVTLGMSTKQIADKLKISDRTVETHRINLLKKMKSANTAELIRKAFEYNLITQGKP
jgi:DNA-binding NarL/FixJ family response regulator